MKSAEYFAPYRALLPAAQRYTYLNSAGCGPLATPALESMTDTFARMAEQGQVNVEIHDWLKDELERVRRDVAAFINAEPEEIWFVRCIAEGLNSILRMFHFAPGDEILISDQENPATILPCFVMEPESGLHTAKFCGLGDQEALIANVQAAMTPRTRMLVSSHVFHTTGARLPAEQVCAAAARRGILTVLDGAQASGNIPIDVKRLGCDFYLLSCHKWLCGPEGVAAVYIRRGLIDQVAVPGGGVGVQESFDFVNNTIRFRPDARRFEYGGRHTPMYCAFSATIRLAQEIGPEHCIARREQLHRYCRAQFMEKLPAVEIVSPMDDRIITGIFSFHIPGADHRAVVRQAWAEEKMIIQWRTLDLVTGKEGIRVSLNWFVTEEEVDQLVRFIGRVVEGLR